MREIIVGFLAGIVTATGSGGGTILMILGNLFLNIEQKELQKMNLMFFIPVAMLASWANYKNKLLKIKHVKIVVLGGIVGATIGALFAQKISSENLKKYFGIFLLLIAIMEIYNFLKENILNKNTHTKRNEK